MKGQSFFTKTKNRLSNISRNGWVIGGGIFLIAAIIFTVVLIPKTIQFSYAGASCARHFTIAPSLQSFNSSEFTVQFKDTIAVSGVVLASTKLCVEPTAAPKEGSYVANLGLKQFAITVPKGPTARTSDLVGKTISIARPLTIQLTSADVVHRYNLKVADKQADCKQAETTLSCDVAPLGLQHATSYTAALHQTYKDSDKKILEGKIETLQPLLVKEASVGDGQTIYDKPTSITIMFDQPVASGDVSLVKVAGETTQKVAVTKELHGTSVTVQFAELEREVSYRLEVSQAVAENGSSLAEPLIRNFKTAGGPQVSAVSIGEHSVGRSATATVTFDQPIDPSIDIAKFARLEGVAGSVQRKSDTQLAFTLQGGDCTAFSLVIDKGLKSGSSGAEAKEGWRFGSRTVCGSAWSIGTSVQGRSIMAYSFGSGASTILFTGGIHGSEPSGATTMQAWVQYLQAYGNIVPADKRIVIVPNTNPDGIAAGTRNNSRGVNIDRNFPASNWQSSIETASGTLPNGGGTSPGSEPETAALITLTRQLRPRLAISFHAQGRLVGANKVGDSVAVGNIYAGIVGYATMFNNPEAVMGYAITGEYEDWMGEEMGIAAILIELPTPSGNYLSSQLAALKRMLTI